MAAGCAERLSDHDQTVPAAHERLTGLWAPSGISRSGSTRGHALDIYRVPESNTCRSVALRAWMQLAVFEYRLHALAPTDRNSERAELRGGRGSGSVPAFSAQSH